MGKKAKGRMASDYLDGALADFSGYIAADELYDGPFCVLSIVDNRQFKRLVYDVLDHNPTHEDIRHFFGGFKAALDARSLTVLGITTDASPLYPGPVTEIFGHVPHQVCEFHTVAEITKAVLKAVARVRKALAAQMPKLPRGRPASKEAKHKARTKHTLQQKVTDLFDNRHLLVQHYLTPAERKTLVRISRGHRQLRALREIMEAKQSTASLTAAAGARQPCRNWPSSADGCVASRRSARRSRNSSVPTWKRPSRSSTISYCLQPPTPWSAATAGTARCRKRSTACAPRQPSATGSPLI